MKIGLLFAGQGAQYTGMGKSLYEGTTEGKRILDIAGEEIKNWCFDGTKEMLRQTQITQPCVYAVTMAAYGAFLGELSKLEEKQINAIELQGIAGFSLGEYAALTAGGVISGVEKGLEIVTQRGRWMSEAGKDANGENRGGMVAAFGKREQILACVETSREAGILEGVNFNSPQQTVVAGDIEALSRFKAQAKEMGGMKVVTLSVGTAFHSPMMAPAEVKLRELLSASDLQAPAVKIYANVTGRDMLEGAEGDPGLWIADMMARQAKTPVYWQETIENMCTEGIEVFIELGPGNTLSGFCKKIKPNLTVMNIEDLESLKVTMNELKTLL